jgi:transcription elongation factor Elf1
MRWFKHLSMAHSDHAVSAVLEELGAEAYGVWWLIIEDIAAAMESKSTQTFAIHSDVKWSQICYCSARKFRSIANRLQEKGLIVCTSTDNRLQIDVPKLLKFRDEYSKKSGHSPDSRTDTDGETDTDTNAEIKQETLAPSALALEAVAASSPAIGTIPLVDGSNWSFTQEDVTAWREAYPAVDVLQQLREMREWCKSNRAHQKTARGIRRFVTSWLSREQDKPTKAGGFNERTTPAQRSMDAARDYLESLRDGEGLDGDGDTPPSRCLEGDLRRVC